MMRRVLISSLGKLSQAKFKEAGMEPIVVPTIRLEPERKRIDDFTSAIRAGGYGSLVLLSPRALDMIMPSAELLDRLSRMKIFAVGPTTRASIEARGLKVAGMPHDFTSQSLGVMLAERNREASLGRIALVRSSFSDASLLEFLTENGLQAEEFRIYSALTDERGAAAFMLHLAEGVDAVVFTSRSSAYSLVDYAQKRGMLGALSEALRRTKVVCMGRETAKGLDGIKVDILEPEERTIDGVIIKLRSEFK